ncbi:MAG TPA: HAMP domain-containing sensor histidine kinase, partial [Anaeromyxobacteraceae bacterium]|nr:HAMP domain-containing sensor histidine kinase [Anaeromyxobacteraceae bacterium]
RGVRNRFILASALPALASLGTMALLAHQLARRALEDELSTRLVTAAQGAAVALRGAGVEGLAPGGEASPAAKAARTRLEGLARATSTWLVVLRPDGTALVDSEGRTRTGDPVILIERDRDEIARAAGGKAGPGGRLFEGADGQLHKAGYAPLTDASGRVVAVVGADGTSASFATLRRFRRFLVVLAVIGAAVGAFVSAIAAVTVTRPLARLADAARRIGRGDLKTPIWRRRRKDEIAELRDTLEEMRQGLAARDEERETLLAGIAHEVRNPLGGLTLFSAVLAEETAGTPAAAHVERVQHEVTALTRVVEEFLDYARARPLVRQPVDLAALLAEVGDLVRPLAAERGASVRQAGDAVAQGDREKLRRAALNLARNAVEASQGGEVVLAARRDGAAAVVEVLDRGPGLTVEARAKLFRPFFTTKERGTGLGLALAKKVADAHGGTLALLEREGGGTVARLTVPDRV